MGLVNHIFRAALWIVIIAVVWRKFEQPLQETLVNVGLLDKRLTFDDVCDWVEECPTVHELLGCELKSKIPEEKIGAKPKLKISKKLLKKKTFTDRMNDALNSIFLWCQSCLLPEEYRVPCLFGDCGMDQEIKRQKDILMYRDKKPRKSPRKSPLFPPTPHMAPTSSASEEPEPTPYMEPTMAASDDDGPTPHIP